LLSLSYGQIKRKDIESKEGLLPESFDGYNIVEPGDTVLRLTDLQNDKRSLRTGLVQEKGIITSAYTTVRPRFIDSRWLYYSLHIYDVQKVFYSLGSGLRQSMNFEDLKSIGIAVPEIDQQRRICDWIDFQTSAVDKAILLKQRQIDCLNEESKGLTLSWLTEDSFSTINQWDAKIGSHGIRAKLLFETRNFTNVDAPLASATMQGVQLRDEMSNDVWNPEESSDLYKLVEPEDFVIGLRSFQHGFSYSEVRGKVSPAYTVFRLRSKYRKLLDPVYFSHLFQTRQFISLLESISVGIRQGRNIPYEAFADLRIPVPEPAEMAKIVEIQARNRTYMTMLAKSLVPLLQIRTALITDAITGKIDLDAARSVT
jgi:type I restriction enzyme S subunit